MIQRVLFCLIISSIGWLGFRYGYASQNGEADCVAMHWTSLCTGVAFLGAMLLARKRTGVATCFLAAALTSFIVDPAIYGYGLIGYALLCIAGGAMLAIACEDETVHGTQLCASAGSLTYGLAGSTYGIVLSYRTSDYAALVAISVGIQVLYFMMALIMVQVRRHIPHTWKEVAKRFS